MEVGDFLVLLWPYFKILFLIVAPFVLAISATSAFTDYRRSQYFLSLKYVLLEINVPKESVKTPLAMEVLLSVFNQVGGEATFWDRIIKGKTRPWFSLEIAAIDGQIHFFIWTREEFSRLIEQQVYAEYPGAIVNKVEDYTKKVEYDPKDKKLLCVEYTLGGDNAESIYPIRTYNDFNLQDEKVESELRVDPLNFLLEFLSQTQPGEQFWIQFVIRAHKGSDPDWSKRNWLSPSTWGKKKDDWSSAAVKEIAKIKEEMVKKADKKKDPDAKDQIMVATKGQADRIAGIERKISKIAFDVGVRTIYLADKDKANKAAKGIAMALLKPYDTSAKNYFFPQDKASFKYPWEDFAGVREEERRGESFLSFQKRAFFFFPKRSYSKTIILNIEELATLYHFPSTSVLAPAVSKIMSKHSEPPPNLPI